MSEILVKKRNGKSEPFNADKTNKVIKWACEGVQGVVENEIAGAFHTNIRNGISTKEIHKGLIDAAVGLINETNPNYEIAAANLLNYELRKRVWKGKDAPDFYSFIVENTKNKRYTEEILQWYSKEEIDDFGKYIKHDRDFNFKYSGLSQVIDKYLIKTLPDKKVYETPQIAYMLIAMVLFHDEKGYVKEIYDSFSNFDISLPTPIFAGVRTNLKSFASCFPKNQVVLTIDGEKHIQDVDCNDLCLTHKGNYKKVLASRVKEYNGNIVELSEACNPVDVFKCTEEHLILAIKKRICCREAYNNTPCNIKKNTSSFCFKKKDDYKTDCDGLSVDFDPQWIEAKDLNVGDFVHIPFDSSIEDIQFIDISKFVDCQSDDNSVWRSYKTSEVKRFIPINNDFMEILGWYLSEGCASIENNYVQFTLSIHERDYQNSLCLKIKEVFGLDARSYDNVNDNSCKIIINSTILGELFVNVFKQGCDKKILPLWIMRLPAEKQKSLLKTLLQGDGCTYSNGMSISLVNEGLIKQAKTLCLRCGVTPSINKSKDSTLNTKEVWILTINKTMNSEFIRFVGKNLSKLTPTVRKSYTNGMWIGKDFYSRVNKISEVNHEQIDVYDLQIEEDESFCVNGVSVHNCLLLDMGDSVDEICSGFEVIAKATSKRFGIGVNMTKMRPIGAPIRGGENIHTGKVGFLRTIQDTIKTWLQSSTRSGAATVTVPIWDYEIEEILQLKDPMRLPENRVGDIDYLISISKLFYSRWARNEKITLFNAHEVPELERAFGLPEFDELYLKAESNPKLKFKKVVNMRDIGDLFQKNGIESGRYYLLNIDHANSHGSFTDKIGMANLCVAPETLILTKDGYETISDLEGLNVEIWNGIEWSLARCEKTGSNQKLIEITFEREELDFDSVESLWTTEYHKFYLNDGTEIRAKDLKIDDVLETFSMPNGCSYTYRVVSISDKGRVDDTFCVNEPIRHRAIFNGVQSGQCVEITHPTFPMKSLNDPDGLLGICILLASNAINLKSDEKHQRVCELSVRILDKLIDYQEYFCLPAENFATKFRSLGIGMTNFAALLAKKGLKYSSQEAREYANELFEKNLFYLIQASVQLAKEKGPCEWLSRTKYGKGILPIDNYAKSVDSIVGSKLNMDWETLRQDLIKYGIRNATLVAKMPCEASSLVTNSTNGLERPRSKFVSKGNKSKDLPTMVPNFKKWAYEYAFDNPSNEDHIKMMAIVQKYCDMSISTNFYYNYNHYEDGQIPMKVLNKDIFDAYRYGLKTIYYRNSEDGNNHNLNDSKQESCESGACAI